jgi:hypothetical protein
VDSVRIPFDVLLHALGLMHVSLDGRNMRRTAQRFYPPRREFPVAAENPMRWLDNCRAGFPTLSHTEHVFLTGPSSTSQWVF